MTTIKLKNGSGAPTAGDLVQGEPALDLTNKRLYTEDSGGTVIEIGTNPSTINIDAGTIDGTVIGGTTTAAGSFTTITGSGDMAIDTDTLFVDVSADKVGIGTSSPATKLHVAGGSTTEIRAVSSGNLTIGAASIVRFGGSNSATSGYVGYGGTASTIDVWNTLSGSITFGTANTERMRINSSGNVGIGTSSPASKLDINGDGTTLRLDGTANTSRTLLLRNVGGSAEGIIQTDGNMHFLQEDASKYMRFSTANTERMRIDSNGVTTFKGGTAEQSKTITSSSGAATLNLREGDTFIHDLTENVTYTFSNPAASGSVSSFTLKVIQDSTARTITWPSSVDWAGGTAPTLTTDDNGVDIFVFFTHDGGTTYYGFAAGQDMK